MKYIVMVISSYDDPNEPVGWLGGITYDSINDARNAIKKDIALHDVWSSGNFRVSFGDDEGNKVILDIDNYGDPQHTEYTIMSLDKWNGTGS